MPSYPAPTGTAVPLPSDPHVERLRKHQVWSPLELSSSSLCLSRAMIPDRFGPQVWQIAYCRSAAQRESQWVKSYGGSHSRVLLAETWLGPFTILSAVNLRHPSLKPRWLEELTPSTAPTFISMPWRGSNLVKCVGTVHAASPCRPIRVRCDLLTRCAGRFCRRCSVRLSRH